MSKPKPLLKSEKEVLLWQDKREKAVLAMLEKHYRAAFNMINQRVAELMGRNDANLPHVIRRIEYQKIIKQQVKAALDMLHANEYETIAEFLNDAYTDAFVGAAYTQHHQDAPVIVPIDQNAVVKAVTIDSKLKTSLYEALGADVTMLKNTITAEITRGIASGMLYDDIIRNIADKGYIPLKRARTIVRTETGRVQEQATFDEAIKAKQAGADVVKQWSSIRDGRTRDSHRKLDGQVRELDEPFEVNGHTAMHPHGFGIAAEDVNCRCTMLTRARAALDQDELKLMEERAAAHRLLVKDKKGFDGAKVKDFADFKAKYLKAAEKETATVFGDKTKKQEKPKLDQKDQETRQPVSVVQENQRGIDAMMYSYEKRLQETGVKLISADEYAKLKAVDYAGIEPRSAAACNEVLEKYAGKYNTWLASVNVTNDVPANVGGYVEVSNVGGTATMTLNAKQMKNYDKRVEVIKENGLSGHGVRVNPLYYDQYIMTHEFGHTLLKEGMEKKSAVGVDHTVYKKALKEAKRVYAEYQQEYHDLSNRVIALKNEEIKLNDSYMNDDADIFDLMERGKKLVSELKEAEEKLESVTISRYANSDFNEFIAEAWTEREIGENPGRYSQEIGAIIDKYFKF